MINRVCSMFVILSFHELQYPSRLFRMLFLSQFIEILKYLREKQKFIRFCLEMSRMMAIKSPNNFLKIPHRRSTLSDRTLSVFLLRIPLKNHPTPLRRSLV